VQLVHPTMSVYVQATWLWDKIALPFQKGKMISASSLKGNKHMCLSLDKEYWGLM